MKANYFFVLILFLGAIVSPAEAVDPYLPDASTPTIITGKKLVWNDEFDQDGSPNKLNWKPETGFVRNSELQYYQLANATCTNGTLLLTAKRDTVVNTKYVRGNTDWRYKDSLAYWTSASLITQGLKTFRYGRIDVRARIDTTYGSWPAIWQKGISGSWPACGEVDILEFYNKRVYANAIFGAVGAPNYGKCVYKSISSITGSDINWTKKFHLWTEVWKADSLKLYLDGVLMNSMLISAIANPSGTVPANGFQQQHFFLLNLAVGSNGGTPRKSTSKTSFEVDYIRVYQDSEIAGTVSVNDNHKISFSHADNHLRVVSDNPPDNLIVFDTMGRVVYTETKVWKSVSLVELKSGIYIAKVVLEDGHILSQTFIK